MDRAELRDAVSKVPSMSDALWAICSDSSFHGVIGADDAAALAANMGATLEQLALALVPVARIYAVVPVSNFKVGAVAVGLTGALYFGANLEFSGEALSFTVHAEQACTANAWLNGEQGMASLGISAAPCGYCRQFLYELVDAAVLSVVMPDRAPQPLTHFLPDAFGPHDLGVQGGLMQAQANGLTVDQPLDPTAQAALAAANACYSPYTGTFAGVALTTSAGVTCTGRYAENAAYNPSMSPLEAALSQLVLYGRSFSTIVQAVLVEASGPASQVSATRTVLAAVSPTPLKVYTARPGGQES